MAHDPKKVPDPSPTCPRCHYFEQTAQVREGRVIRPAFPRGIDQAKALDLLVKAFPRSYGQKQ